MDNLSEMLTALQDPDYRLFQSRLMPTVPPEKILGVRTPALRAIAKQYGETREAAVFLSALPHRFYEEDNLHAFLIERIRDFDACIAALDVFLPFIDNWATCDSLSAPVLFRHKDALLPHIRRYLASGKTYTVRFGIRLLMNGYLETDFRPEYPALVAALPAEEYYIGMMAAWYFATALAKQYEAAFPYVEKEGRLFPFVRYMAVRKALESRRISPAQKACLRALSVRPAKPNHI